MSIDINTLRNELIFHLGVDNTILPQTSQDLLLNRAWWEVIYKYRFREKEVNADFQLISGTAFYPLPSPFEALRQVSVEDPNNFEHVPLKPITVYRYEQLFINDPTGTWFAKPVYYAREGCGIRLLPVPDQAYNVTLKYWTVLSDLGGANNPVSPSIPQVWHETILYGAIYRGFLRFLDFERGKYMKDIHKGLIDTIPPVESKEEEDYHEAGVNVKRRDSGYEGILPGNANTDTSSFGFDRVDFDFA